MGIIMQDGFDTYGTDEDKMASYGWVIDTTQGTVQPTLGRFGGGAFSLGWLASNDHTFDHGKAGVTTFFFFMAFHYAGIESRSTGKFIRFQNVAGNSHVQLHLNSSAQIEVYDATGSLIGTSTETFPVNVWHTIQVKVVMHDTAGSVEAWGNGVQLFGGALTNEDTIHATGTATFERLMITELANGGDTSDKRDDVVIWDDSGSNFNTWTAGKDIVIETRRCNAVGNLSQWTKSAGANNYENVDETPDHDADSTYNYNSTPGNADRINIEALSVTPDAIYNVRTRAIVRKTDAGPATVKIGVYSSTTEDVSVPQGLSTDYIPLHPDNEVNPADSLAWEKADIDALQVQYEVA